MDIFFEELRLLSIRWDFCMAHNVRKERAAKNTVQIYSYLRRKYEEII